MAKFRTAMGKVVDMSALASRNEKVRAVGNMKVNARVTEIEKELEASFEDDAEVEEIKAQETKTKSTKKQ